MPYGEGISLTSRTSGWRGLMTFHREHLRVMESDDRELANPLEVLVENFGRERS